MLARPLSRPLHCLPAMARPVKNAANHGRAIFIYNNIHTNQVVYSLTRSLNVGSVPPQHTHTPGATT